MEEARVYNTFTGVDTIVGINEVIIKDVDSIQVHKKGNVSSQDFCSMIPELCISTLDSVKNLDGIVVLNVLITDKELEIPSGATIQLGFANEYGFKLKKEIEDCHVIKRALGVSTDTTSVIEEIILVAGYVGPIEKFDDTVDGN